MSELRNYAKDGWPMNSTDVSTRVRRYRTYREEISCVAGLLFKNHKLIMPSSLRREKINKIHESHLGVVNCKGRARETLFWPGMANDTEFIARWGVCASYNKCNPAEMLIKNEEPN